MINYHQVNINLPEIVYKNIGFLYHFNKQKLREIDRRIRFLSKRLEVLKAVPYSSQQEGKVFFGAWVTLVNDVDETLRFRIVGPDEIYAQKGHVSIDSPMARACLGKEVDDEVVVKTELGIKYWEVKEINYTPLLSKGAP